MSLVSQTETSRAVAVPDTEFKKPLPKPKKVLEEEDYEESITRIIERDFFPDLPKLVAQHDYLEALRLNDTEKLREIHIKYGPKRKPTGAPDSSLNIYSTPASFETPSSVPDSSTPGPRPNTGSSLSGITGKQADPDNEKASDTDMRLDKFLFKNTSEDDQSFVEIMAESDRKRREKQAWLYVKEGEQLALQGAHLALPSIEEQAALEGNPTKLQTWTYRPANAVMYNPEGAPLTAEEKIELSKKQREINTNATRFQKNPFEIVACKTTPQASPLTSRGVPGRVGPDGKEIGPATPAVGGYGFVATPSPVPGVAESPLMTWGEIEGTPFLLDASDRPILQSPGPTFKLSAEPKRDRIGRELAEKVAKQHRDKKQQVVESIRSRLMSPSATKTERFMALSPAAQRLASVRSSVLGTDKALRASYTPDRPVTGGRTPKDKSAVTPVSKAHRTPSSAEPATPSDLNITDNLLDLPAKRKKAADFF